MSVCCPTCGRRTGKGWRKRFTDAEKAAIAHRNLKLRVKQIDLARELGVGQGTISRIVASTPLRGARPSIPPSDSGLGQ